MRAATLFLCLSLAACTQFPELDGTIAPNLENADFPDLIPLEPLMAETDATVADPVQTAQALGARVARLRGRAAALQRRDIVDAGADARLDTATD